MVYYKKQLRLYMFIAEFYCDILWVKGIVQRELTGPKMVSIDSLHLTMKS
jgi:hypothetical protein